MQSVFVIITRLIASKIYLCKEFCCNNFGRNGSFSPNLQESLGPPLEPKSEEKVPKRSVFLAQKSPKRRRKTPRESANVPKDPAVLKKLRGIVNYYAVVFLLCPPYLLHCQPLFERRDA